MKKFLGALLSALFVSCAFASGEVQPFAPDAACNVVISATGSSAATALAHSSRTQTLVYNAGSNPVFIEFGTSGVTASTATSLPVAAGAIYTLSIDPTSTHVATKTGGTTEAIHVCTGRGN